MAGWWTRMERAAWSGWPCWHVTSSKLWAELPGHAADYSYVSDKIHQFTKLIVINFSCEPISNSV